MEAQLIERLGVPISMMIIMVFGIKWIAQIAIKHFIKTIDLQTLERRETNAAFVGAMNENTKALQGMHDTVHDVNGKADQLLRIANGK